MTQPTKESQNLATFAPALILLVICFLINYVDRGNISIAAPLLKKEFGLTESQLGVLFATFFVTYTAGQFVVGWLVDRFEVTRILAAGFLVWSLATAATGVVRGFGMLLARARQWPCPRVRRFWRSNSRSTTEDLPAVR